MKSDNPIDGYKEINESPGSLFFRRWSTLLRTYFILGDNSSELEGHLYQISLIKETGLTANEILLQMSRESNRLIHNFITSAATLVDHSRRFMENYQETELNANYQEQVQKVFHNDPMARFVRDLRNFIVHRELPFCPITISFSSDHPLILSYSSLNKSELLQWNGWTKFSKIFINRHYKVIEINSFTLPYWDKVREFYTCIEKLLKIHHNKDIENLKKLTEEYDRRFKSSHTRESFKFSQNFPED